MRHLYIFGTGGFGREALTCFVDICQSQGIDYTKMASFVIDDEYFNKSSLMGISIIKSSDINYETGEVFVAIGDPFVRQEIVRKQPDNAVYAKLIHPTAIVSDWVNIGEGSIVCAGSILTTQIDIGKHAHINLNTTIGHDCSIGNFFTSSPGVNISGNCTIGSRVFIGTNTSIREKTNICDDSVIGMSSSVLKSIEQPGVYFGNPAQKIN